MLALLLTLSLAQPAPGDALLRRLVGETALEQVQRVDPLWHPEQRDCAGLVRFAYRTAYRRLRPGRLQAPLFRDGSGRAVDFADAESLLRGSFRALGRDGAALRALRTGDVLGYRQERAGAEAAFHLMLVVVPEDPAHGGARVVYHPGEKGAAVRTGLLRELVTEAPLEWRPVPENGAFLGFFRFREWMP